MRIVFSRKGFDSSSGGGPSPIVGGKPTSLPIPAGAASRTTYGDLGLGELVEKSTRGRLGADDLCHHDPMFLPDGQCLFGQCGAAQTHLANSGVGIGDVFLFFGLFADEHTGERHHRIFGFLEVERVVDLANCSENTQESLVRIGHPHALAMHAKNDVVYSGRGEVAKNASEELRLTVPRGPPSLWTIPPWLRRTGLTYHDRADRWLRGNRLKSVARGQEFVADIGRRRQPLSWVSDVIAHIERTG